MPGFGELLLILFIVLLVFGATKIPEIARSLSKGIHEFKKAANEDDADKKDKSAKK